MGARRNRPTIYDIAKAALISPSTVSIVLGGDWKRYRIKDETANRILAKAEELGYTVNLKARGLRLQRSGLAGMILPHYRNRFFAGLAESFEVEARRRGLCPVSVGAHRKAVTEISTAETLVAQQVEFLFVAGVNDPTEINRLCASAKIPSINIDLPGEEAPSAISDNRAAAKEMMSILLDKHGGGPEVDFYFFGGNATDNATIERMQGVREAFGERGLPISNTAFNACGYVPTQIAKSLRSFIKKRGGTLPAVLFANGITALEGLLILRQEMQWDSLEHIIIGCFDWDPFAASLPLDIIFVRQDVQALIAAGFRLLDDFSDRKTPVVRVPASIRHGLGTGARSLMAELEAD